MKLPFEVGVCDFLKYIHCFIYMQEVNLIYPAKSTFSFKNEASNQILE